MTAGQGVASSGTSSASCSTVAQYATPTPEGLKLHSKVELLKSNAWTVPTLAGTRLYVRDRRTIMALDLK